MTGEDFEVFWTQDDEQDVIDHLSTLGEQALRKRCERIEEKFETVTSRRDMAVENLRMWQTRLESSVRSAGGASNAVITQRGFLGVLEQARSLRQALGNAVREFNAVAVERDLLRKYKVKKTRTKKRLRLIKRKQKMEGRKDFLLNNKGDEDIIDLASDFHVSCFVTSNPPMLEDAQEEIVFEDYDEMMEDNPTRSLPSSPSLSSKMEKLSLNPFSSSSK